MLKFGLLFLTLACAGALAQRHMGDLGFLFVSVLGGLVSSASTTATAAALAAAGKIPAETAGIAAILTSMSSALVNLPLVYQQTGRRLLTRRVAVATVAIVAIGIGVLLAQWRLNVTLAKRQMTNDRMTN